MHFLAPLPWDCDTGPSADAMDGEERLHLQR